MPQHQLYARPKLARWRIVERCGNALSFLGAVVIWANYAAIELACVLLKSAKLLLERATRHFKFDAGKAVG